MTKSMTKSMTKWESLKGQKMGYQQTNKPKKVAEQ